MAPIPVLVLRFVVLFVVLTISLVLFREISSVSLILTIIPVMVVLVVAIIDAELNALRCRRGHDCHRRCQDGSDD